MYTCPICGFFGLDEEPYYSYEICPCCGIEFGFDDPGLDKDTEQRRAWHSILRARWLREGASWFDETVRPATWCAATQLKAAGLPAEENAQGNPGD